MRIFVLTKKSVIVYAVAIFLLLGIFVVGNNFGQAIFTEGAAPDTLPIYSVETPEKKIAITFDAAWGNEDTDALLKILGDNNARASIFVVGGWIDRFPDSVKAFHNAGHEILNHSDTHAHMSNLSAADTESELSGCEQKILDTTGVSKKLFRAPYGEYDDNLVKTAGKAGYKVIQWDVDSLDWKDLSPDEIINRVKTKVRNGSIILFHNGAGNTPAALEKLLPQLAEEGYSFVPVSELIYENNYKINTAGRQIPN